MTGLEIDGPVDSVDTPGFFASASMILVEELWANSSLCKTETWKGVFLDWV
jgi:hypothetical protein